MGTFDGNTYTPAPRIPQWPNPETITLAKDEWYLFECLSHVNGDDPSKTFVRIVLDKQTVWEGEVSLTTQNNYGGFQILVGGTAELLFNDVLVQRIDRHENPRGVLFVDTFDGSQKGEWEGIDDDAPSMPYMVLEPHQNPTLDLSAI